MLEDSLPSSPSGQANDYLQSTLIDLQGISPDSDIDCGRCNRILTGFRFLRHHPAVGTADLLPAELVVIDIGFLRLASCPPLSRPQSSCRVPMGSPALEQPSSLATGLPGILLHSFGNHSFGTAGELQDRSSCLAGHGHLSGRQGSSAVGLLCSTSTDHRVLPRQGFELALTRPAERNADRADG